MTPAFRRTAQLLALVLAALVLGGSVSLTPAAAQAAQVTVTLTANHGVTPEFIEVPVGGTIVFVNEDDTRRRILATEEAGKSAEWAYDAAIEPGATSPATPAFTAAGRYTFNDIRGLLLTATRSDELNALAPPPPSPSPSAGPSAGPSPSGEPGAAPSGSASPGADGAPAPAPGGSASPGAPAATGGTGTTSPLPLDGGFLGGTGTAPVPIPGDPLAPAIAPPLLLPDEEAAQLPYIAAPLDTESPGVAALPIGSLPGVDTGRENGLPAVLAGLAIVGLVSMLVRVLLAEPAARRSPELTRGLRPVVVTG